MQDLLQNKNLFKQACYINGKWLEAKNNSTIEVRDPATGKLLGKVPNFSENEALIAVSAADKAFDDWSKSTATVRAKILHRWFELVQKNRQDLALILTLEQGKPITEALKEIDYAASFIEWFAEEAKRNYGTTIPAPSSKQRIIVINQAIGPIAAITPWNFPSSMVTRKIAPALAAACTIVLKPAPETPFSATALGVLAEEAGVPAGVLNIITGEAEKIGQILTKDDRIKKLSFTGSTEVGKLLLAQCADTVKKVSLELGGNAPFIVFADSDMDVAIKHLMLAKFRNNGQTCICANRVYVERTIMAEFATKLANKIKELRIGNGLEDVDLGPLISKEAVNKIKSLIYDATNKGAEIVLGGEEIKREGYFFEPTLLQNARDDMLLAKNEIFGPVVALYAFDDVDEVIKRANDTEYGLAAYIFTDDYKKLFKVSEALQYGMIGVNDALISNEMSPFGGVKHSGLGREGSYLGMKEYLNVKYLCIGEIN